MSWTSTCGTGAAGAAAISGPNDSNGLVVRTAAAFRSTMKLAMAVLPNCSDEGDGQVRKHGRNLFVKSRADLIEVLRAQPRKSAAFLRSYELNNLGARCQSQGRENLHTGRCRHTAARLFSSPIVAKEPGE